MSLKTPAAVPPYDPSRADMRLPEAAFKFKADNRLLGTDDMRHLNITAWLYRDNQGVEGVQVNSYDMMCTPKSGSVIDRP